MHISTEVKEWISKFKYAIIVVFIVLFVCIVCVIAVPPERNAEVLRPQNIQLVNSLLTQIKRLHLRSIQDSNPIFAVINSTKAIHTYKILKHVVLAKLSNEEIYNLTATNVSELYQYLEKTHKDCIQVLTKFCPDIPAI